MTSHPTPASTGLYPALADLPPQGEGGRRVAAKIVAAIVFVATPAFSYAQTTPANVVIVGDAIPAPLTTERADAKRGRAIVANRQVGLCLLCHSGPFPEERFQGTIAPSLAGAGSRSNEGQLRLRLVDATRVNAATVMPSYYRIEGFTRVAATMRDKPILTAQQIEDVVAYLSQLKD